MTEQYRINQKHKQKIENHLKKWRPYLKFYSSKYKPKNYFLSEKIPQYFQRIGNKLYADYCKDNGYIFDEYVYTKDKYKEIIKYIENKTTQMDKEMREIATSG